MQSQPTASPAALAHQVFCQTMIQRVSACNSILGSAALDVCDLTREDGLKQLTIWSILRNPCKAWYGTELAPRPRSTHPNLVRLPEHIQVECLLAAYNIFINNQRYQFDDLSFEGDFKCADLDHHIARLLPQQAYYKLPHADIFRLFSEVLFFMATGFNMSVAQRDACGMLALSTQHIDPTLHNQKATIPIPQSQPEMLQVVANAFKDAHVNGSVSLHTMIPLLQAEFTRILAHHNEAVVLAEDTPYQALALILAVVIDPVLYTLSGNVLDDLWSAQKTTKEIYKFKYDRAYRHEEIWRIAAQDVRIQAAAEPLNLHTLPPLVAGQQPLKLFTPNFVRLVEYFVLQAIPPCEMLSTAQVFALSYDNTNNPNNNKEYIDNSNVIKDTSDWTMADILEDMHTPSAIDYVKNTTLGHDLYTMTSFGRPLMFFLGRNSAPFRGSDVRLPWRDVDIFKNYFGHFASSLDEDRFLPKYKALINKTLLLYFENPNMVSFIDDRSTAFPSTRAGRIYKSILFTLLPAPAVSYYTHPYEQLTMPAPDHKPKITLNIPPPSVVSTPTSAIAPAENAGAVVEAKQDVTAADAEQDDHMKGIDVTSITTYDDAESADGTITQMAMVGFACVHTRRVSADELSKFVEGKEGQRGYDVLTVLRGLGGAASGEGEVYYLNDVTQLEAVPTREPYLRYGAAVVLNKRMKPVAAYVSHMKKWMFNNAATTDVCGINSETKDVRESTRLWNYAKWVWKTTMFVHVTVKDHLTLCHLYEANGLVLAAQSALPQDHVFRSIYKPFMHHTVFINHLARVSLYSPSGYASRIWAYDSTILHPLMKSVMDQHTVRPYLYYIDNSMNYGNEHVLSYEYNADKEVYYNASKKVEYQYQNMALLHLNKKKFEKIEETIEAEICAALPPEVVPELSSYMFPKNTTPQLLETIPTAALAPYQSAPTTAAQVAVLSPFRIDPRAIRKHWRETLLQDTPTIDISALKNIPYDHKVDYHTIVGPPNAQYDRIYPLAYDVNRFWAITFDFVQATYDLLSLSFGQQDVLAQSGMKSYWNALLNQFLITGATDLLTNDDKTNEFERIQYSEHYTTRKCIEDDVRAFLSKSEEIKPTDALISAFVNKVKFVVLTTQLLCNGTINHELCGAVTDYLQSPTMAGSRIDPKHQFQERPMQYVQEYTQILTLAMFTTGQKSTGLLSNAPHLYKNKAIKDKYIHLHQVNWFLYKRDLLCLMVENDFRNRYLRDFPLFSCNPRNLESSVGI